MFSKIAKLMPTMAALMVSASLFAVGGNVYLSTISDSTTGDTLSRSLLQFHKDGTLTVSDSDQQGESTPVAFVPFGTQHGYWEKEHGKLEIKTVNFQYPKYFTCDQPEGACETPQQIVVFTAKLKKENDHWQGPTFLSFFDLDVNNINDPSQGSGPFPAGNIILDLIREP